MPACLLGLLFLVAGAFGSIAIASVILAANGDPAPMDTIEQAFDSEPMGSVALLIIFSYIASAIAGAAIGWWAGGKLFIWMAKRNGIRTDTRETIQNSPSK